MCFGNNGCGGNSCLWIILILIITGFWMVQHQLYSGCGCGDSCC